MNTCRRLTAVALLAAASVSPSAAAAQSPGGGCERDLDEAILAFDEAFAARDFDTYMSFYVDDAVQVDGQGNVFIGRTEIEAFIAAVMANDYTFEATVINTRIEACKSATVIEDSTFAIPSAGFTLHLIDGVSWVRQGNDWRVVQVQNTTIPAE